MLNTPLTKLRKDAPGSLTAAKVAAYLKRRRFPRDARTVGAFERGQFKNPPERFLQLYAEAIEQPIDVVREALTRTLRMRERAAGPFSVETVT
jgi:hypothetical protein